MPHQRPRASDFDDPPRYRRPQSPSPHRQRRLSPSYDPPPAHHSDDRRRRLTPEQSLDRYHSNHSSNHPHHLDQSRPVKNAYSNGYRQGGRDDFFEKRRLDRENAKVDFWPKSPDRPYGEDKKRHHSSSKDDRHHQSKDKKKKHRHDKSDRGKSKNYKSDDSGSDRHHHRSHKKHKSHKHHKSRKYESEDSESNSDEEEVGAKEHKRHGKSKSVEIEDDVWMEKEIPTATVTTSEPRKESLPTPPQPTIIEDPDPASEEDLGDVGPMPYNHVTGKAMDPKEFGRALRPGEGSAMAAFIEAGERIPRRGEIGLTGNEIEKFENVGYVMSGSRHRRMNAVRIRKENQVISAEEKRGILKMQAEEKAKREGQIISSFRELVDTKLQETG